VEQVRATLPELPAAMAERFVREDGLPAYDAAMVTQSLPFARYYETGRNACGAAKLVANWMMGEVSRRLNTEGRDISASPVDAATLAALIRRIGDGTVSNNAARQVFDALWLAEPAVEGAEPTARIDAIIEAKGLKQMNDSGALEKIVAEVVAANPKSVEEYRAGKEKAFNALVGQVMKASRGKANPAQVNELLKALLA
jgi:aspartyl-tRNA(Asn)/glutamyl-tRNA(Gln) amidotransferase subunit B